MKQKIAIFDFDGVLVNMWEPMRVLYEEFFKVSLTDQEWVDIIRDFDKDPKPYAKFGEFFNTSEVFANLPAQIGMQKLVKDLKDAEYDLAVITSAPSSPYVIQQRKQNAFSLFGDAFKELHFVGSGQKYPLLGMYAASYKFSAFVDDTPKNVENVDRIVSLPMWWENEPLMHHKDKLNLNIVKVVKSAEDIAKLLL